MRYRRLDINGDMTFGHQQADFLRDSPVAVAQAVATRLRLWLGEWFIDTSDGTQYQDAILGKNTAGSIEPALRSRILETVGVTGIESFEMLFDSDNRKVTVNALINTLYGEAAVQGIL